MPAVQSRLRSGDAGMGSRIRRGGQTPTDVARARSKVVRTMSVAHFQPLCKRLGVPVVDLAARMSLDDATLKPGMTIDGIHFSAAGFAPLQAALNEAVALAFQ